MNNNSLTQLNLTIALAYIVAQKSNWVGVLVVVAVLKILSLLTPAVTRSSQTEWLALLMEWLNHRNR